MPIEYKIKTGEQAIIERGFLKKRLRLIYCGMPNDQSFCLAPIFGRGHHGFAPPIYYSYESVSIRLLDYDLSVLDVTTDYIILSLP